MSFTLFIIGTLLFALALHPFVTYPLSLLILKRFGVANPARPIEGSRGRLRFAVCTCAYNEESVIEEKIANLLSLRARNKDAELFLYIDAASDRTAALCEPYRDVITLHVSSQRHGKTHGMNLLVEMTRADIVVFTDANVMLADDVLERLEAHFADPAIGCVCGNLRYTNDDESVTSRSGGFYWRIEEGIKRLETATGSVMGADGSLFAVRRALHKPPPDHIIDDMFVSFMVLCQGKRVVQASDVTAFEASATDPQEEFQRKVRIACQAFNVHRLLWPELRKLGPLLVYKYVSHKLLRWFSIYLIAGALILALFSLMLAGWWYVGLALATSPLVLWALGARWPIQPFSQIFDIAAAFAGTGLGVWRSIRGERFQTWAPVASVRRAKG